MVSRDQYGYEGLKGLAMLVLVGFVCAAALCINSGCSVHLHLAPSHFHKGEPDGEGETIIHIPPVSEDG